MLTILRTGGTHSTPSSSTRVLRDVSAVNLRTKIAGAEMALPVGIAPASLTRLVRSEGEVTGAQAAARFGIPFSLSTMGTLSFEDAAAAAPDTDRWFQLYLGKDRVRFLDHIRRGGPQRHVLPPTLTAKTILDASYRPEWWFKFLPPTVGLRELEGERTPVAELVNSMFDPSLNLDGLARGAGTLMVSNRCGRQLDRAPVPLKVLPEFRAAVGSRAQVILDSGIITRVISVRRICSARSTHWRPLAIRPYR